MRLALLTLAALFALLPACGSEMATTGDEILEAGAPIGPEITRVAFRDRVLVVHTGERFSLMDGDGNVLAAHVTADELAEIAPVETALYREMAAGVVIDASVDPELLAPAEPFVP